MYKHYSVERVEEKNGIVAYRGRRYGLVVHEDFCPPEGQALKSCQVEYS